MKKIAEALSTMVDEEATKLNTFVVGHSRDEDGLFRFFIDSESLLDMKTLTEITRNVSARIDETITDETPFTFEVSSPGADNSLTDIRQFGKHIGRTFEIELSDSQKFEGKLMTIVGNQLAFEKKEILKVKNKKTENIETVSISFENIKSAIIKLVFK